MGCTWPCTSLCWKALNRVVATFRLIHSAAEVRLPLSTQQSGVMLDVVNDTLRHSSPDLQAAAVAALSAFAAAYAAVPGAQSPDLDPDLAHVSDDAAGQERGSPPGDPTEQPSKSGSATDAEPPSSSSIGQPLLTVVVSPEPHLAGLAVSSGGAVRRGSAMALGALPPHLLRPYASHVMAALASATQVKVLHPPQPSCLRSRCGRCVNSCAA